MSRLRAKYCSACGEPLLKGFDVFNGYHAKCPPKYCNFTGQKIDDIEMAVEVDNLYAIDISYVYEQERENGDLVSDGEIYSQVSKTKFTPEEIEDELNDA